jgi:hypothetical protein
MSKPTVLLFWFFLTSLPAIAGEIPDVSATSPASELPRTLFALRGAHATFVRADAVLDNRGEVDLTLFASTDAETIKAYLSLPEENGCVRLQGIIYNHMNQGPHADLKTASAKAKLILLGIVMGQASGFRGAEAGSLLEVKPETALKGAAAKENTSYYVFFPAGEFELGGKRLCAVNPSYPALPQVGDRLLLFVRDVKSYTGSFLPLFDATDIIVLRKDSQIDLPRRFKSDRALGASGTTRELLDDARGSARRARPTD